MRDIATRRHFIRMASATIAISGGVGTTAGRGPANAPFDAQLNAIRGATRKYRGEEGIKRAYLDGYRPSGPTLQGNWFVGKSAIDDTPDYLEPNGLIYLDNGLKLGALVYAAAYPGDGPPDHFNDEGEDLKITEEDGWIESSQPAYPFFSNQNGEKDDITELPLSEVFDQSNWWGATEDPGSTLDIDGDGKAEIIDHVTHKPPIWSLHVWIHTENPEGLFAPWYCTGCKRKR